MEGNDAANGNFNNGGNDNVDVENANQVHVVMDQNILNQVLNNMASLMESLNAVGESNDRLELSIGRLEESNGRQELAIQRIEQRLGNTPTLEDYSQWMESIRSCECPPRPQE